MSSVVENQTQLKGRVLARSRHPSVDRWDVLQIEVSAADEVEAQPNLLGETVGRQLTVAADRADLPDGDLTGWEFDGLVRLAGPDAVVAVPAAAASRELSLTPPSGDSPDRPRSPQDTTGDTTGDASGNATGDPPPAGTWPAGDEGPRPEL
jgi:hypothetical protein